MPYALQPDPAPKPPKPKEPKHLCGTPLRKREDGRYFCPRCLQAGHLMPNKRS